MDRLHETVQQHSVELTVTLEQGYVQVGQISTDFYCDGEIFVAVVQKKEEHH